MHLDLSRFPLVFIRADTPSDAPAGPQFEAMLERGAPFVLIGDGAPHDHREETHEDRKARALFFKQNKDRLRVLCRGIILIEGAAPMPASLRLAAQGIGKAFGTTVSFVRDEAGALEAGAALLR